MSKKTNTGKVKFFNESKGYGFITDDSSKKEIFVHITDLIDQKLKQDDKVAYNLGEGKKGTKAIDVELV